MALHEHAPVLAERYLGALAKADLEGMLDLFTAGAKIHSPLYGCRPATEFYQQLFADTSRSEVELVDLLTNEERQTVLLLFDYRWQLASGAWTAFRVADWLQLDAGGKITELHIFYDTAQTRPAFEQRSTDKK